MSRHGHGKYVLQNHCFCAVSFIFCFSLFLFAKLILFLKYLILFCNSVYKKHIILSQYFHFHLQNFIFFCNTLILLQIYQALFWLHICTSWEPLNVEFDRLSHDWTLNVSHKMTSHLRDINSLKHKLSNTVWWYNYWCARYDLRLKPMEWVH